ncbi:MAG: hypothetical protein ABTD50_13180 [Polyangiaceae bacterium]|jgi:hypothetical protein
MTSRRADLIFGTVHGFTAVVILVAVFGCLPTRYGPVDWTGAILAALECAATVALLGGLAWRALAARIANLCALALGLLSFTVLLVTATWLGGVYGQVGRGGAILLGVAAAVILPYLILLPAFELAWMGPESSPRS